VTLHRVVVGGFGALDEGDLAVVALRKIAGIKDCLFNGVLIRKSWSENRQRITVTGSNTN